MSQLFGDVFGVIESSMRFRVARQSLLAGNVANADTPGYRRVDLEFEHHLRGAGVPLATGSGRHLSSRGDRAPGRLVQDRSAARLDGNNVNLDRELVQLSRNAGAFSEQASVMSRLIEMRRTAISARA